MIIAILYTTLYIHYITYHTYISLANKIVVFTIR